MHCVSELITVSGGNREKRKIAAYLLGYVEVLFPKAASARRESSGLAEFLFNVK